MYEATSSPTLALKGTPQPYTRGSPDVHVHAVTIHACRTESYLDVYSLAITYSPLRSPVQSGDRGPSVLIMDVALVG